MSLGLQWLSGLTPGEWLRFGGGSVELFFALVFGFVGLVAILYSAVRVRAGARRLVEYYCFLVLLLASAVGLVYARNLILAFTAWELATLSLWRLVAFFRTEDDVRAGTWALLVNFGATTFMLVGVAMLLLQFGSLEYDKLAGASIGVVPAVLVLIGILAKSATLPLYVWMPRAYRQAPAPVCALLSGVAENLGIVLFFRLFVQTFSVPAGFLEFVAGLALVSSLVAGAVALAQKSLRSTLAYSTISQLGFIFLGLAVAGYYGILGALLYVLAHAVAKSGLFFAAGLVEDSAGTGEFERLGGVTRRAPVLATAAALLVLSIVGLPPLVGFFAKLGVVLAALENSVLLGVGAIVAALFTVLYLARLYTRVFLGADRVGAWRPANRFAVFLVVLMALVSLGAGVTACWKIPFLERAIAGLAGGLW